MRRRLRIAISVCFAVLTVLLCVLWVRSYWCRDHVQGPWFRSSTVNFWSSTGQLTVGTVRKLSWNWRVTTIKYPDDWIAEPKRWGWAGNALGTTLFFPHWILPLTFAVVGITLWIPWSNRFSLRTLLIATTLLAVVLGLIAWLVE
jgi:hypothetical protein